jgi:serine/threonine protein kinase/dipeptidyl aminopeptidase/acylaminoacyl peptidase
MLAPGARIGSFEVLAPLGAGGMGEVYRARDPRLGREVAIKVLPTERLADEARRKRLVQEARAASALSHRHIVTIYEIGSADGIDFIVMEYVAGQTLDGLIPKSGMPLRDALRVAISIADALAAAHAKSIVHRDLKPANVIVSRDGVVKVLDFGLAKVVTDDTTDCIDQGSTASVAAALSRSGAITGTAGYMSPEQATGGKADARSDIFSFGAVLYEMVTGRRAFTGKTLSETLTAVVSDQPKPPREIVRAIPEPLERLILRCLRKEADRRFQNMLDVKLELQELEEGLARQHRPVRHHRMRASAAALVVLLAASAATWFGLSRVARRPPPTLVPLTTLRGIEFDPSFSPDGNQVAFTWSGEKRDSWDIYIQIVGSSETRRLTSDPAFECCPAWSPDGRQIAILRATADGPGFGRLHIVSPLGGTARPLGDQTVALARPSWSPDGHWLATGATAETVETAPDAPRGIRLVRVPNGEARTLTSAAGPSFHSRPAFSPDGARLAYAACHDVACWIDVIGLDAKLETRGTPQRLSSRVIEADGLAWTRDGKSLVYGDDITRRLWRIETTAGATPERIELAGFEAHIPAIAPTGDRLAFVRSHANPDVYRFRPGGPPEPVAPSSFADRTPVLSPDGSRFAFASSRSNGGGFADEIWVAAVDGSNATQLTTGPGVSQGAPRWSPDGRRIAFDSMDEDGTWHVWTIDADGSSPHRLTSSAASERDPTWSHDGRFIFFTYGPDRGKTIWRAPAAGGPAVPFTSTGGGPAEASPDGRTLYFQRSVNNSALLAVPVDGGPERTVIDCVRSYGFSVSSAGVYHLPCGGSGSLPLLLWDPSTGKDRRVATLDGPFFPGLTVSADGGTILYSKSTGQGADLVLIENFR